MQIETRPQLHHRAKRVFMNDSLILSTTMPVELDPNLAEVIQAYLRTSGSAPGANIFNLNQQFNFNFYFGMDPHLAPEQARPEPPSPPAPVLALPSPSQQPEDADAPPSNIPALSADWLDRTYKDPHEARDLLNSAQDLGFTVSILSSKRKGYAQLGCWKSDNNPSVLSNVTVKTGCRFRLSMTPRDRSLPREQWEWMMNPIHLRHNHDAEAARLAMPAARRASVRPAHAQIYLQMDLGVAPRLIEQDLDRAGYLVTAKDLDNLRSRRDAAFIGNATTTEAALRILNESDNVFVHWVNLTEARDEQDNSPVGRLEGLLLATPQSRALTQLYPDILLMDCTYRSNQFNLPLLHIAGTTGHGTIFTSALVFMGTESIEWYERALRAFSTHVLMGRRYHPRTVMTDRAQAIITALPRVFPEAQHLYCQWHIMKNIQSECRRRLGKRLYNRFMKHWRADVLHAESAQAAELAFDQLAER